MDFYQACYGKPDGINWTVFNDTIPDALSSHKSLFVKTSSYCSPDMVRSVLGGKLPEDLYELVILKDATCLFRAKYWNAGVETTGAKETRDVMFAHGFVFNTKDVSKHPESLLSIRDDNFKFTVEETAVQPELLSCDPPLGVDSAMSAAGLTKETWNTLMECIYSQRDSRSDEPLYIKASTREEMKALIYCILIALPKQLRFSFAFSNENSISGTMFGKDARGEMIQPQRIFFTNNIPAHATYFEPEFGGTNADLRDIQNGIAIYSTYNIFRDGSANAYSAYCDLLDEVFAELKLPDMATLSEVELASLFVEGDAELENKNERDSWKYLLNLMKKLRESRIQSAYTDNYIANVLEKFDKRGFNPNDTIIRYVNTLSDNTTSPRLSEIYKKLQIRALMGNGKEAIEAFLDEKYKKGGENFHSWCERIVGIDGGLECVSEFYEKLMKSARNYVEIDSIYRDGKIHIKDDAWDNETLRQFLRLSIGKFSCKYLDTGYFGQEFIYLQDALFKTFGTNGDSAYQQARGVIVKRFWDEFDLDYFEFTLDCIDNCRKMGREKGTRLEALYEIYDVVIQAKSGKIEPRDAFICVGQFHKDMSDYRNQQRFNHKEREILYPKIQAFLVKELRSLCGYSMFEEWTFLARLSDEKNPMVKLYQWGIPIVCNPEVFETQLAKDKKMQRMLDRIDTWISGSRPYSGALRELEDDPEAVKVFKREEKAVAEFEKRETAAAKKQAREVRRQEKQIGKRSESYDDFIYESSSDEPSEKKGFLGGIFGGKNKNKW